MKYFNLIFLCFVISFSFHSCENKTIDDDIDSSMYYEELDISYGNESKQKFDIYLPANRTSTTQTIILVHGGGWSSGDKADMDPFKDLIRQELPDLAVVNINYRLSDENNPAYPMQINDITTIIDYLKDNKTKYGISDNFGFVGTSAGGHLALLWSYAFDTDKNIKMVCSIVGPTNLADPAYLNSTSPELAEMLNYFGVSTELSYLEEVSPLYQLTASAPPTILFYGGKDPLVPITQGTDLRDKLETLNVTHEFTLYPNGGHGWEGLEIIDTWVKLKAFTQTHL